MQCEHHARTVIIFTVLLPVAVSGGPVALQERVEVHVEVQKNKKAVS
jgi:hypothetical protein